MADQDYAGLCLEVSSHRRQGGTRHSMTFAFDDQREDICALYFDSRKASQESK
jgi:hypothetical protein